MITSRVCGLVSNGRLETEVDVVASIEGQLQLRHDGNLFFEESSFPLVELAVAITQWLLDGGPQSQSNFEFDSMFAEEPGILWFRAVSDGWRVGSIWQEAPCVEVLPTDELILLAKSMIKDVRCELEQGYGVTAVELLDRVLNDRSYRSK